MNKFLFGFDLSLKCSGITIFDLDDLKITNISSIRTKDKDTHGKRLFYIASEILKLKKLYPPRIIAIERGFSRFNASTQAIYKTHGLVNYLFHDIEQIYYPPKTVKEAIIRGDATKKFVRQMIEAAFPGVEFANEDESDSYAIVMTYLIKNKYIQWDKEDVKKKLR